MRTVVVAFVFSMLYGCAFNGHLIKQCPGGTRLVTITKSKSSNSYLAMASEEARLFAKCAKLDLEEHIEKNRSE